MYMARVTTYLGTLMADILDRPGADRNEVARRLRVSPSQVSNIRYGKSRLNAEKFGILAEIHGSVSEHEIRMNWLAEKMERETGISLVEFISFFTNPARHHPA